MTEPEAPSAEEESFDWSEHRLTDEQVKQLAIHYISGSVHSATFHGPQHEDRNEDAPPPDPFEDFSVLRLVLHHPEHRKSFEQEVLPELGDVYEYLQASSLSVNGRPSFISHKFLHKDDFAKLLSIIRKIEGITLNEEESDGAER